MAQTSPAYDLYVDGLKNAHGLEKQALSIMRPQLARLEHYPEMSRQLSLHIDETEAQIERLDQLLTQADTSASSLKDTFLSAVGGMASLTHAAASDEVLKNTFANHAFENFEIAAYTSLITSAQASGEAQAIPLLTQTLEEETRMANWIASNIAAVTETYISLQMSGQTAKV